MHDDYENGSAAPATASTPLTAPAAGERPGGFASGRPTGMGGYEEFLEKELLNGRLAMLAVTAYVLEEVVFQTPVVRYTPELFRPLIFSDSFRAFMDASFSAASMDASIDGVAY